MDFHCETCHCKFDNDSAFQEHLEGNEHFRKERDTRTIFIHDAFDGTCLDSAKEFVAEFGSFVSFKKNKKSWRVVFEKK